MVDQSVSFLTGAEQPSEKVHQKMKMSKCIKNLKIDGNVHRNNPGTPQTRDTIGIRANISP